MASQSKVACKLPCGAGTTHRGIEKLATLLWLAVDEIHRPAIVWFPAIVGRVILGHLGAYMVTVIGNLVIEFALLGVHTVEPVKSPLYLVHDIGHTIGTSVATGVEMVGKCSGVLLVGKHQLINGIGARCGVLQQVGSVVPAAAHINALAFLGGMVSHIGILGVTTVVLERVVATLLLAHVVEHKVGSAVINCPVDGKGGRRGLPHPNEIGALLLEVAEIQSAGVFHVFQR